ncbi:hypothetical protein ACPWSG_24790, partial [Pandoraea pneumonica]
ALKRTGSFCATALTALLVSVPTSFAATDDTSAPPASAAPSQTDVKPEIVGIVVPGASTFGGDISMHTEVYKPAGNGPFPVLIFEHGRAGDPLVRA